ncbi:MAG: DUF4276 family protein [Rhodospirillaceae bacterium]|nr:DUF4276 family protein [Rhodospirillales bacterium]
MVEVIIFAEGQTEEKFIKLVVAPALRGLKVFVKPQTLNTSRDSKGGAVSFDRLKRSARNTLNQSSTVVLSTFLDLYGLDTDFPGFDEARNKPLPGGKAGHLEAALHGAIVNHVGCRPERFIPHIQPHEYEGLLFSDVTALAGTEPGWHVFLAELAKIRQGAETPEHINGCWETRPSKRLEILTPGYKKTRHGPLAAERITLEVMERECHHFRGWMDRLRALA